MRFNNLNTPSLEKYENGSNVANNTFSRTLPDNEWTIWELDVTASELTATWFDANGNQQAQGTLTDAEYDNLHIGWRDTSGRFKEFYDYVQRV